MRRALNPVGKKGKLNKKANATMAKNFKGVQYCEARLKGCWGDVALSWAHHSKRRRLTPEELTVAALVCIPCHDQLEVLPAEEMKTRILELIAKRETAFEEAA
jgi:hypothetical protein